MDPRLFFSPQGNHDGFPTPAALGAASLAATADPLPRVGAPKAQGQGVGFAGVQISSGPRAGKITG